MGPRILFVLLLIVLIGCEDDATTAPTKTLTFDSPIGPYFWGDTLKVKVSVPAGFTPQRMFCYINGNLDRTLTSEPWSYGIPTHDLTMGQTYRLSVVAKDADDNSIHSPEITTRLMPFPFDEAFLANYSSITARDINGNVNGEADANDWVLRSLEPGTGPNGAGLSTRSATIGTYSLNPENLRVMIEWRTLQESNNRGFHLYRGLTDNAYSLQEGQLITSGGMVTGAGDSDTPHDYLYEDRFGLEFYHYYHYWLITESFDNVSEPIYLGRCAVVPNPPEYTTQLHGAYPNPLTTLCNLSFSLAGESRVFIAVFDGQQNLVQTEFRDSDGQPVAYTDGSDILLPGRYPLVWTPPTLDPDFYRIVFRIELLDGQTYGGYGDVVSD